MQHPLHILADDTDLAIKALIFVGALIIWAISSIAKLAKSGNEKQKQRLRQVREQIAQSAAARQAPQQAPFRQTPQQAPFRQAPQARARQAPQQRPRAPVQLAPAIARRIPPAFATRPPKQRPPKRAPANYNVKMQAPRHPGAAPPPLPATQAKQSSPQPPATLATGDAVSSVPVRKAATVNAQAINRWLKPITLKQQFILTEVFQPPMSLRS